MDVGTGYGRRRPTWIASLTEVGAGTPMGELLRRYWHPVGLSSHATATPREVRVLGGCEHPNIIKLIGTGRADDGTHYYTMEHVPGADLDEVFSALVEMEEKEGPLTEDSLAEAVYRQRRFDALVTIFTDKAAHDRYQSHPRHLKFVELNTSRWKAVRAFDAWV